MKNILVCGGAGYIGSVAVKELCDAGYNVCVFDNLSKGLKELVDPRAKFIERDLMDMGALKKTFKEGKFDHVMHFAALKAVGESMEKPDLYSQNIIGFINLLNAMVEYDVKKLIFSSSAAVYGNPVQDVITENHPKDPINFYGFTKLEMERVAKWYSDLKGVSIVAFRYFNVAGDGGLNYIDPKALNIFPVIGSVMSGDREKLQIFGDDYDTKDGTCVRDYVHVKDIVSAHIKAIDLDCDFEEFNLSTQNGSSVMEIVNAFEKLSGKELKKEITTRRPGDPGKLIANSDKARKLLNWKPKFNLDEMVLSTLKAYKI